MAPAGRCGRGRRPRWRSRSRLPGRRCRPWGAGSPRGAARQRLKALRGLLSAEDVGRPSQRLAVWATAPPGPPPGPALCWTSPPASRGATPAAVARHGQRWTLPAVPGAGAPGEPACCDTARPEGRGLVPAAPREQTLWRAGGPFAAHRPRRSPSLVTLGHRERAYPQAPQMTICARTLYQSAPCSAIGRALRGEGSLAVSTGH